MTKVTLAVLAEKIDNMCDRIDEFKAESEKKMETLRLAEKANTEFRQKAIGAIGLASLVGGSLGAFFMFVIGKVWR